MHRLSVVRSQHGEIELLVDPGLKESDTIGGTVEAERRFSKSARIHLELPLAALGSLGQIETTVA